MGKRARPAEGQKSRKKYKIANGILEPCVSGIYATCARKHEKQAAQELGQLFQDKVDELYCNDLAESQDTAEDNAELSVEDQIKKELQELKSVPRDGQKAKKEVLKFIDLNCECVVFCKTRQPVQPADFVHELMQDFANPNNMQKRTRYVQKLTPVTFSTSASMVELTKLAEQVLKSHFHVEGVTPLKFAVEVTRRNFNTIEKMDIIKEVARVVGKGGQLGHTVDLKEYDKLILVECFKNNIGMSVVDSDYRTKYKRYNVQQIYEAKFKEREAV
ncbi:LAMI_0D02102g1_1 [Lachancea mirantina]|uniref:LAMI_0D02102g1_1 n=1 Tax=Lachancea mirantina TaxID=1230905 RepID=A0A1G4J962_9SACH|nr:LAMI_0D02102g1_1 [Lachancea mirantina]